MKQFCREHKLVLISAVLMAILIFLPVILTPFLVGDEYRGINSGIFENDEWFLMAKGKEILDGHNLGNIFLNEGKDWYNTSQTYIEYLILAPVKILNLSEKASIATIYQIYGFLGVVAAILLIYFFVFQVSGDKLLGTIIALFVLGGYNLVTNFRLLDPPGSDFNIYLRPILPISSLVALFIFLNLLVKSLKSQELRNGVWAGAALGATFYIYFFCWTYALTIVLLLICIYLFKKDFEQIKKLTIIFSLGILIGSYVLLQLILINQSEVGQRILFFYQNIQSRSFVFSRIAAFPIILFLVLIIRKSWGNKNLPLIFAIILTSNVVINQQLVTGRTMQPFHYFLYFVTPMSILVILFMIWELINKRHAKTFLFIILMLVIYVNLATHQYRATLGTLPMKRYVQRYSSVINFLNKNYSLNGSILASDQYYGILLATYTKHDLFWNHFATIMNTSYDRITESFCVYAYLNRDSRNDFQRYFSRNIESIDDLDYYRPFFENIIEYERHKTGLERDVISAALNKKCENITSGGIVDVLKKYRVDYIVWDKNRNPEIDLDPLAFHLKEVLVNNSIYLYKLQ